MSLTHDAYGVFHLVPLLPLLATGCAAAHSWDAKLCVDLQDERQPAPHGKVVEIVSTSGVVGYGLGVTKGREQEQVWLFLRPFERLMREFPPNQETTWRVTKDSFWETKTNIDAFNEYVRSFFESTEHTYASGTTHPVLRAAIQGDVGGLQVKSDHVIGLARTSLVYAWDGSRAVYEETWFLFPDYKLKESVSVGKQTVLTKPPGGTRELVVDITYTNQAPSAP